jgi:hypothetical protein
VATQEGYYVTAFALAGKQQPAIRFDSPEVAAGFAISQARNPAYREVALAQYVGAARKQPPRYIEIDVYSADAPYGVKARIREIAGLSGCSPGAFQPPCDDLPESSEVDTGSAAG